MHSSIQQIIKNSPHLAWMEKGLLYLCLHGSKAYNCHTETSDDDFKGITLVPRSILHGFLTHFDQAELKDPNPDTVIYNIKKFFNLAVGNNPNLLEMLYVNPEHQLYIHPLMEKILEHRKEFLSTKVRFSFGGFAFSQMKRVRHHRAWLLNPMKEPPTRDEMGLPPQPEIGMENLKAAMAAVDKELDKFNFNFMTELDNDQRIEIKNAMHEMLTSMQIFSKDMFTAACKKIGMDDNLILIMQKEREYKHRQEEWRKYCEWKTNRNEKRAADEAKYGYDCYDDATEFLTEQGWKKFDEITQDDKLATIFVKPDDKKCDNRAEHLGIEYQNYTEKFDGKFNGNFYKLTAYHTECYVTSNHNMFIRKVERLNNVTYDWQLIEASRLPDTFEILQAVTPVRKNYSYINIFDFKSLEILPLDFAELMGWYLSDGCANFRDNEHINLRAVRISQEKNGKLYDDMVSFYKKYKNLGVSLYEYERKPNIFNPNEHIEVVLVINNEKIVNAIVTECGYGKSKRIPRWVYKTSVKFWESLLNALIKGDGTKYITDNGFSSNVYYSSCEKLADDVQELAVVAGWVSSKRGPYKSGGSGYECDMFQVYLNKLPQFKKCIRNKNISTVPVIDKRIVCFSVPNGILITRYNGHVAIQGNCKFGYHIYRLYTTCKEILTEGRVNVFRHDRDEIMKIRRGEWTFEQLEEFVKKSDAELEQLYKTTTVVPRQPNVKFLDKLCQEIIEQGLNLC